MNANEARELATSITTRVSKKQYDTLLEKIETAAKKGNFYIYHHDNVNEIILNKLRTDGFVVTSSSDQRDGTTITIKW